MFVTASYLLDRKSIEGSDGKSLTLELDISGSVKLK